MVHFKRVKMFSAYFNWSDSELLRLTNEQNVAQFQKRDLLNKIIATNDKDLIQKTIDYIYSKSNCMFKPCQFLFSQIYKIEHAEAGAIEVASISVDLSEFDEGILESNRLTGKIEARMALLKNKAAENEAKAKDFYKE